MLTILIIPVFLVVVVMALMFLAMPIAFLLIWVPQIVRSLYMPEAMEKKLDRLEKNKKLPRWMIRIFRNRRNRAVIAVCLFLAGLFVFMVVTFIGFAIWNGYPNVLLEPS